MDLSWALLESIRMIWEDEYWVQNLDYEQVHFRCHRCHKYGRLFQECTLNNPKKNSGKESDPLDPGFTKVDSRKKGNRKKEHQDSFKKMNNSNPFEILGNHEGEYSKPRNHLGNPPSSVVGYPTLIRAMDQENTNDIAEGRM